MRIRQTQIHRKRIVREWVEHVKGEFESAIEPHVSLAASLLDAGCGTGQAGILTVRRARFSVGCDMDEEALRKNRSVSAKVVASLDRLPFRDGAFDAVVCDFVVEHLERPEEVFCEIARSLCRGAVIAILTPNTRHPAVLATRLIPCVLRRAMKKWIIGNQDVDVFRTWYRANTPGHLRHHMDRAGFRMYTLSYCDGAWVYMAFSVLLTRCVRFIEEIQLRISWLRPFGMYIVGVWRKA